MAKTYTLSGGRKVYNRLQEALFALGLPTGDNCLLTVVGRQPVSPGDPVDRLIAEAPKYPVFEILPG